MHRGIKDSGLGRFLAGAFGHPPRGPKAVSSRTYALAWVRDDVARELGLINDSTFPARVSAAWGAVGRAAAARTGADRAYWKKRRASAGLREAREAARAALVPARSAAGDAARRLAPFLDAAEAADTALARAGADAVRDRAAAARLDAAADALDGAATALLRAEADAVRAGRTARATEDAAREALDALHGWAALPGDGPDPDALRQAEEGLTTARRTAAALRFAAGRRAAAPRTLYDTATGELAAAEGGVCRVRARERPGRRGLRRDRDCSGRQGSWGSWGLPGPTGLPRRAGLPRQPGLPRPAGLPSKVGSPRPAGVPRPAGPPSKAGSPRRRPGPRGPGTDAPAAAAAAAVAAAVAPGPGTARARRTADARRTGADRRLTDAAARQRAAARRLTGPVRADAAARAALARATGRSTAADRAFDTRRAELDALARTTEAAAADLGRVRAATDRLTRWHQLNATAAGRRRLGGLAEPAPVTSRAPPAPPVPTTTGPARPRYTPSAGGSRLTSPEGVPYTVHEVPRDGDAFFHALAEGLARTAPTLLARHGIDPADPLTPRALRRLVAARLSDPADADLLAAVAPDDTDVFTAAEADATGPAPDLAAGAPGRREFDQRGVVPHAAALDDGARAALATAQLVRPGEADGDAGWDHSAADLLPLLAARTFGIDVTVVRGDGSFQAFTPGSRAGSGRLHGLVEDPDAPRPHVVLVLDDRHYRLAVATPATRTRPVPAEQPPPPTARPAHRDPARRRGVRGRPTARRCGGTPVARAGVHRHPTGPGGAALPPRSRPGRLRGGAAGGARRRGRPRPAGPPPPGTRRRSRRRGRGPDRRSGCARGPARRLAERGGAGPDPRAAPPLAAGGPGRRGRRREDPRHRHRGHVAGATAPPYGTGPGEPVRLRFDGLRYTAAPQRP
ncbi:hypothetical protein ACFWSP_00130 [Streptomyces sp. NPDC058618]|uniref:hypothetical protein n=1 Tax=Streptomyces sp. NPDC058618 TaxID=3346558 RepID=UPI0036489AFC